MVFLNFKLVILAFIKFIYKDLFLIYQFCLVELKLIAKFNTFKYRLIYYYSIIIIID